MAGNDRDGRGNQGEGRCNLGEAGNLSEARVVAGEFAALLESGSLVAD